MTAQKDPAETFQPERTENIYYISGADAAKKAGVVPSTIANWASRYPTLGVKVVGRWRINPAQLQRILEGQMPLRNSR